LGFFLREKLNALPDVAGSSSGQFNKNSRGTQFGRESRQLIHIKESFQAKSAQPAIFVGNGFWKWLELTQVQKNSGILDKFNHLLTLTRSALRHESKEIVRILLLGSARK